MEALLDFLSVVYQLKGLPRTGWVLSGVSRPETVASHSFGVALLGMVLGSARSDLDQQKLVRMALTHDLAESLVGDLLPEESGQSTISSEEKHRRELDAMQELTGRLRGTAFSAVGSDLLALFAELEEGTTPEAVFVRHLDKTDMLLQARLYEREQGVDLQTFYQHTPPFREDVTRSLRDAIETSRGK